MNLVNYIGLGAGVAATIFGTINAFDADNSRLRNAWVCAALNGLAFSLTKLFELFT